MFRPTIVAVGFVAIIYLLEEGEYLTREKSFVLCSTLIVLAFDS